jgi:hypothetical protein
MTFGICGEGASGLVEVCVEADAGEEVEEFAFVAGGAGDAAGGEEGEAVCVGDVDAGGVRLFFTALEMALEFDEEVVFSERIPEAGDGVMEERGVVGSEGVKEGALVIAGECDQAGSGFCEFVPSDARASFWASKMGACEELAEVSVSFLRTDQYGQDGAVFKGQFGSGDGTDAVLCTGAVQAWDAVETVTIGEGKGGQVAVCCLACEGIGGGCASKKAERASGVEFNITHVQLGGLGGGGAGGRGH